jgi:hypothetical protein
MAMAAQKTITTNTKHLKLKYQINFAQALSKMKHRIVRLVLYAHDDIKLFIQQTIHYVSKTIEAVRGTINAKAIEKYQERHPFSSL